MSDTIYMKRDSLVNQTWIEFIETGSAMLAFFALIGFLFSPVIIVLYLDGLLLTVYYITYAIILLNLIWFGMYFHNKREREVEE